MMINHGNYPHKKSKTISGYAKAAQGNIRAPGHLPTTSPPRQQNEDGFSMHTSKSSSISNDLLSSVLNILVEEVRELKQVVRSNKQDIKDILVQLASLQAQLQKQEQKQQDDTLVSFETLKVPIESSLPQQSQQPCPYQQHSMAVGSSHPNASIAKFIPIVDARHQLLKQIPFLSSYSAYLCDPKVAFVVDDIEKPFVAFLMVHPPNMLEARSYSSLCLTLLNSPPILIHTNELFCKLLGYSKDELVGCPASKFAARDAKAISQLIPYLRQRSSLPMSDILHITFHGRTKAGENYQNSARVQLFYDSEGHPRWSIGCVDDFNIIPSYHPRLQSVSMNEDGQLNVYNNNITAPSGDVMVPPEEWSSSTSSLPMSQPLPPAAAPGGGGGGGPGHQLLNSAASGGDQSILTKLWEERERDEATHPPVNQLIVDEAVMMRTMELGILEEEEEDHRHHHDNSCSWPALRNDSWLL